MKTPVPLSPQFLKNKKNENEKPLFIAVYLLCYGTGILRKQG